MKITKTTRFLNQDEHKDMLNPKSKSWNKKNKNKNMTNIRQWTNMILSQKWNQNKIKLWQENVPKTSVEQIKGNEEFYVYFCLLGT
jgi:hypothetical protein